MCVCGSMVREEVEECTPHEAVEEEARDRGKDPGRKGRGNATLRAASVIHWAQPPTVRSEAAARARVSFGRR